MIPTLSPDHLSAALTYRAEALRRLDRIDAEESLMGFIRVMWPVLEPGRQLVEGWALDAICDHLEAVHYGHIKRLLINVPPGFMKSLTTNVFFPAWEWGPKRAPWLRYVSASYAEGLTNRDNHRCRELIRSSLYQELWGSRKPPGERCAWLVDRSRKCDCGASFHLHPERDSIGLFENNHTGWKAATSVKGQGTGLRGDRFVIDDPHSVKNVESDAEREGTIQWATEVVSTRKNDPDSAMICIMQRVHHGDTAAIFMELGWTHLCIPMWYEHDHPHRWVGGGHTCKRPVVAAPKVYEDDPDPEPAAAEPWCPQYGKGDPRTEEGELAWPERFPEEDVNQTVAAMSIWGGSYATDGQLRQDPTPRGGGMFPTAHARFMTWDEAVRLTGTEVRGWDLASTRKKHSAWTRGVRLKRTNESQRRIIVMDVVGCQGTPGEVEALLLETARKDGPHVIQDLPQDPGQAGVAQIANLVQLLEGFSVMWSTEPGEKADRARPLASQWEAGNVWLVIAPWNASFLAEGRTFPKGRLKDQIDASSRGYARLLGPQEETFGAPEILHVR